MPGNGIRIRKTPRLGREPEAGAWFRGRFGASGGGPETAFLREAGTGNVRDPQPEPGEFRIEDIEPGMKSRDDIPAPLPGLRFLYSDGTFRGRPFARRSGSA